MPTRQRRHPRKRRNEPAHSRRQQTLRPRRPQARRPRRSRFPSAAFTGSLEQRRRGASERRVAFARGDSRGSAARTTTRSRARRSSGRTSRARSSSSRPTPFASTWRCARRHGIAAVIERNRESSRQPSSDQPRRSLQRSRANTWCVIRPKVCLRSREFSGVDLRRVLYEAVGRQDGTPGASRGVAAARSVVGVHVASGR